MQTTIEELVERVKGASTWDDRIEEIRRVPEFFGQGAHQAVYAAIAAESYRPYLAAQFAYVYWPQEYSLERFTEAYDSAVELTDGFSRIDPGWLTHVLRVSPKTLRVFRLIVGYTTGELAVAAAEAASRIGLTAIGKGRLDGVEAGQIPSENVARACAEAIHLLMTGQLWDVAAGAFRTKLDKPDTEQGWETVQGFAREGVPYAVLLHQRHYGGPFRTLLDATSSARGDVLELPLHQLLLDAGVPHVRTGSHNQAEIAQRFGITVRPAPDFVIFEGTRYLRAMIECKQANDGGTARDKAARFRTLAGEAERLGGIPLFGLLDGLGWQRLRDALGPVVGYTNGRVFSLETLPEMLTVQPFPHLRNQQVPST